MTNKEKLSKADEMFYNLGYVISESCIGYYVEYFNEKDECFIVIHTNLLFGKYESGYDMSFRLITEEEHKAIIKKLEELQKESQTNE